LHVSIPEVLVLAEVLYDLLEEGLVGLRHALFVLDEFLAQLATLVGHVSDGICDFRGEDETAVDCGLADGRLGDLDLVLGPD
jgi:hypothetical protein